MSSPTLTGKVANLIRRDILMGELKPGQKLVVSDLKDRYQLGASPIREALVQLSWNQYVELAPQKGCWVTELTNDHLNDLFNSAYIVAGTLLPQAAESANEEWELELLTSYHKLARIQCGHSQQWQEMEEKHYQFILALNNAAKNTSMKRFFDELLNQIRRYYYACGKQDSACFPIDIHKCEQIMKLVLARKIEFAKDEFIAYLKQIHRDFLGCNARLV
ncbi:GntR family transcriptional regulator [Vibrio sonorensis]|uniref:GntR family transcriptional regulator n=1 Tax=Vibrio sonorensis TaxID=1004316 RepID=UPI0008DAE2EF|nr:GntR family transcriptional regulator [Vibrio sonorensis]